MADMKGDLPELESVEDGSHIRKSAARKPAIPQLSFKGMVSDITNSLVLFCCRFQLSEAVLQNAQQDIQS